MGNIAVRLARINASEDGARRDAVSVQALAVAGVMLLLPPATIKLTRQDWAFVARCWPRKAWAGFSRQRSRRSPIRGFVGRPGIGAARERIETFQYFFEAGDMAGQNDHQRNHIIYANARAGRVMPGLRYRVDQIFGELLCRARDFDLIRKQIGWMYLGHGRLPTSPG
jgi:hypothetical protein